MTRRWSAVFVRSEPNRRSIQRLESLCRLERSMGANMFIVERSGFRLTKSFYVVLIVLLLITGSFGVLLTMHIHFSPSKKPASLPKPKRTAAELPPKIPECDLPPLPDREGPFDYKGHPYYLYPNGDVDGFTRQGWWRIPFDEFRRHVDRTATTN